QDLAARREQRRAGRDHAAERHEVVLVAAGAVQKKQRARVRALAGRKAMAERKLGHQAALSAWSIGGSTASISRRRGSRTGGSLSVCPRLATGSSTAKPGWSVAISNRMPPGSRK